MRAPPPPYNARVKSTTGEHYIALDHVRAIAAFMVFAWHFSHGYDGSPVPFSQTPVLSLLEEGHTGVALFMTLSGYLFAKLLNGREVSYGRFLWNRFIRLGPLLFLVLATIGVMELLGHGDVRGYAIRVVSGIVLPTWPNGGWSLTCEMHFYVILPLLLLIARRRPLVISGVIAMAMLLRTEVFLLSGSHIRSVAYDTIVGRIDQFSLGILAFSMRDRMRGRHWTAATVVLAFEALYWLFNVAGGYQDTRYSPIWIAMPTLEGSAYAALIAYYDGTWQPRDRGFSRFLGRVGSYSYSIYLLHFFFVFRIAEFLSSRFDLSNFYVALLWSIPAFVMMIPIGYFSFRWIESPFLRLRVPYIKNREPMAPGEHVAGEGLARTQ